MLLAKIHGLVEVPTIQREKGSHFHLFEKSLAFSKFTQSEIECHSRQRLSVVIH